MRIRRVLRITAERVSITKLVALSSRMCCKQNTATSAAHFTHHLPRPTHSGTISGMQSISDTCDHVLMRLISDYVLHV